MKIKQKVAFVCVALGLLLSFGCLFSSSNVLADDSCKEDGTHKCCNNVETSIISGNFCGTGGDATDPKNSSIWHLLIAALQIMTAGVGIAAVGGIVYGALLYTTAEDKPEQTKRAISIITNVVIGLVAYILMFALLNFLIPGGIFEVSK